MQKLCSRCIRHCKQDNQSVYGKLKSCSGYDPIRYNNSINWFLGSCIVVLSIACIIFWLKERNVL